MTETLKRWLTPPQLAKTLQIEPPKVIAWINSGELRAVNVAQQVGGRPRWRIAPDAVDEFMRPRESKTPAPVTKTTRRAKSDYKPKYYV